MKAITIKQPWASLIIRGGKDIENRDWKGHIRGVVAIHSSARLDPEEMEGACDLMSGFVPRFSAAKFKRDDFPLGAILGTVEIVDCVDRSSSPWFSGKFGFVLKNPVAFEKPIPCKGALGFWWVPEVITEEARRQYAAARAAMPERAGA